MKEEDIEAVANVHADGFPRHLDSKKWIECNFRAYPRMQYFVAQKEAHLLGYIQWCQRGGFRKQVVLELEHLAVLSHERGKGIGRSLIKESLPQLQSHLKDRDAEIKHIIVTTRADNEAQRLYKSELAAVVEFTIPDLYSADEVYMISRNFGVRNITNG